MSPKPVLRASTLVALILGVIAAAALAAHPIKGATYKGNVKTRSRQADPISFKVSANGARVSRFTMGFFPVGCQGGGFGLPKAGSGAVSKAGKFKVTLALVFSPTHKTTGHLVITGTFLAHGHEKGTVRTVFTDAAFGAHCNATASYTTKG